MRNPNTLSDFNRLVDTETQVIHLKDIPEYDYQDWSLNDEKDFRRYIQTIEQEVRGSHEYKQYIQYLRNGFNMNSCAFYRNVTNAIEPKIQIHVHHDPITLYDICLIVFRKRQAFAEDLDEQSVAEEVMWLHYNGYVGLIPLSETVHELVHNQYLFVPVNHVFGDWKQFVEMYRQFFSLDQIDTLKDIEAASEVYDANRHESLLREQFTYIDTTGAYDLPTKEAMIQLLQNRKQELYNSL